MDEALAWDGRAVSAWLEFLGGGVAVGVAVAVGVGVSLWLLVLRSLLASGWRWRWRSTSLAEPFCQVCWYASGIIAACQPNPSRAVSVGGEVAPRVGERWNGRIYCPTVRARIISIHFVGWIGRGSSTAHHEHLTVEVKRPRLSCRSRYGGNRADRIRHRIINKRVGRIGKSASRDIAAPTRIDEAADGRRRYVAERNWQDSALLHPCGRAGSKLPDLVYPLPSARDGVESAEHVQLVLKHGEAARNNSCPSSRPRSGHWTDRIRHRIIAEDATGRDRGGGDDRAARTIDVRRPGVGEHAASYVVHHGCRDRWLPWSSKYWCSDRTQTDE